jgi:hypothetical protein
MNAIMSRIPRNPNICVAVIPCLPYLSGRTITCQLFTSTPDPILYYIFESTAWVVAQFRLRV